MAGEMIVVVDDDTATLELLDALPRDAGYQVRVQADFEAAFQMIARVQPDLVLLDLMVGQTEAGWTILTVLRADPLTAHIPAILYSGNARFLETRAGILRRKKRCEILIKPFTQAALLAKIVQVLGGGAAPVIGP
jgi:CheY-like chemotaxis protein